MRAEVVVAGILTLLAIHLHVVNMLDAGALWRDEVNSVEFARMPFATAWHNLQYDSFPMLSNLLLRGWGSAIGAGGSGTTEHAIASADRWLRIYGFLVGLSFLAATWVTVRLLSGAGGRVSAPLLSLALVAMAPWAVQAIDSIRPYGVGIVLIVLTVGFVWRVVEALSPTRIAIAAALAILSVQAMYQNAFLLLAICLAGIVVAWRRSDTRAAVAVLAIGVAAALSLVPYVPSLAGARTWNILVQQPTSLSYLFRVFGEAVAPEGSTVSAPILLVIWIALSTVCAVVAIRTLRTLPAQRAQVAAMDTALYGSVLAVSAIVFYFAGLKAARVRTEPWYYVPLIAVLGVAMDIVTTSTAAAAATMALSRAAPVRSGDAKPKLAPSPNRPAIVRVVLAAVVAGVPFWPAWVQLSKQRTNIDQAAALVSREAEPKDLVVVFPFFYGVSFQRYYHGAAPWITVPPITEHRIHRYDLIKAEMVEPSAAMAPVFARMTDTMKSGHRIWIVGSLPAPTPGVVPTDPPPAPMSDEGWHCGAYFHIWGQEVAAFLENHATAGRIAMGLSGGTVSFFEDVPVTEPSGWKEAGAPSP